MNILFPLRDISPEGMFVVLNGSVSIDVQMVFSSLYGHFLCDGRKGRGCSLCKCNDG